MSVEISQKLEEYTIKTMKRSPEVLIVHIEINGELDQVLIFKGFSSSLTRPTDPNPDIPVIPDGAKIISIDRLEAPYSPKNPRYIAKGVSWETFCAF